MNGHTIVLAHLVELVDAHDSSVRKHHRARLQTSLARLLIAYDGRRETDAAAAATGRVHRQRHRVQHEAQQLRLAAGRVSDEENVDIATQMDPVGEIVLATADHLQHQRSLDLLVAANGRRYRRRKDIKRVFAAGESLHLLDRRRIDRQAFRVRVDRLQVVAANHRAETARQSRRRRRDRLVGAEDLCGRKGGELRARDRRASPCRRGRSRESRRRSEEAGEKARKRDTWPKGARSGIS